MNKENKFNYKDEKIRARELVSSQSWNPGGFNEDELIEKMRKDKCSERDINTVDRLSRPIAEYSSRIAMNLVLKFREEYKKVLEEEKFKELNSYDKNNIAFNTFLNSVSNISSNLLIDLCKTTGNPEFAYKSLKNVIENSLRSALESYENKENKGKNDKK